MLVARVSFERYVVPILPAGAVLAALAAFALSDRVPGRLRPAGRSAILATLLLVPALDGASVAASGVDTTQAMARRWLEANVPGAALVVQEEYAAALRSCPDSARTAGARAFQEAR